jgi:DNA-binding NarL/FixJ family response regulator
VTTEDNPGGVPRGRRRAARPRNGRIHLLIVDQHPLMRAGVRTLLENEESVEVVAEADNVADAVVAARESHPDVVLLDVDESTPETVQDMRRLRREVPDGALVVLARREDDEEVYQAVVGGADGHLGDSALPKELLETIEQAADGQEPIRQTLIDRPNVARRVLETFAELARRRPSREEPRLAERELSILDMAAQGMTNYQIGASLGVSEHTVKSAISQILSRLGLRHRTEAVVYALKHGWISPPVHPRQESEL